MSARPWSRALLLDIAVVIGWFLLLGLVGGLVWWLVATPAEYLRTGDGVLMGEGELGTQVSVDGWYFVLAAVGGLGSGVALTALRRRDALATVVLVGLGALLAGYVMAQVGLWLGPADPETAMAEVPVGEGVPMRLELHAPGLVFVWPVLALFGAAGVLWGLEEHHRDDEGAPTGHAAG